MQRLLSVKTMKDLQDIGGIHKEIAGMLQQLNQFENANRELNQIVEDAKNKVITHVMVPSLGGLLIRTNPLGKRFKIIVNDRKRQFENSILGIKGQMSHRNDLYNETMLKICNELLFHLSEEGINLKDKEFAKYFKEDVK